jgi:hypothetical protein
VIYASFAVFLFVLINGRLHGSLVAVATGIFLILNPHLFDLAHYFKEDPCLLFSMGLALLAMLLYTERPSAGTAGFVGFFLCDGAFSEIFCGDHFALCRLHIVGLFEKQAKGFYGRRRMFLRIALGHQFSCIRGACEGFWKLEP